MSDDLFEKGLKIRKEVLGADYVERSIAGSDPFTRTMAEWSTAYCWGTVWNRPGLDRRDRSLLNLAMIAGDPQTGVHRLPCTLVVRESSGG